MTNAEFAQMMAECARNRHTSEWDKAASALLDRLPEMEETQKQHAIRYILTDTSARPWIPGEQDIRNRAANYACEGHYEWTAQVVADAICERRVTPTPELKQYARGNREFGMALVKSRRPWTQESWISPLLQAVGPLRTSSESEQIRWLELSILHSCPMTISVILSTAKTATNMKALHLAARFLFTQTDSGVMEEFVKLAGDFPAAVRESIAQRLCYTKHPRAADLLARLVAKPGLTETLAASKVLAASMHVGDQRVGPFAVELLECSTKSLRIQSAAVLTKIRYRQAGDSLAQIATNKKEDDAVREACIKSLGLLQCHEHQNTLATIALDKKEVVRIRESSVKSLIRLGSQKHRRMLGVFRRAREAQRRAREAQKKRSEIVIQSAFVQADRELKRKWNLLGRNRDPRASVTSKVGKQIANLPIYSTTVSINFRQRRIYPLAVVKRAADLARVPFGKICGNVCDSD